MNKNHAMPVDDGIDRKGLGDTVEKTLRRLGITNLMELVVGTDCGCQKRKEMLNNLVPYKQK